MNHFIYHKPIWAYQNWSLSPTAFAVISKSPILSTPIDLNFISKIISRLLPKIQRQIVLDFGDDENMYGE
ncbi:MAG: hypothetical protein P8046_14575 [Anaerolineales bacterium]